MGIFSRFSKNETEFEHVLLVDIGSSSVSACFAALGLSSTTLIATVETGISVLPEAGFQQFQDEMRKALLATVKKIQDLNLPPPDRIRVHLSSPWFASQVRIAKMSRPTSFVITKNLMGDILSRELKAFSDEEMAQAANQGDPLRAIESKTLQVRLNGYAVSDPIGLSTRELEFSLFVSVASERVLAMIEEALGSNYPHTPVTFGSFLGASFFVVRDLFPHQNDYILVDIGGEVTDVSIVRDSTLSQTVSFPKGRNFIVRQLAGGLNRNLDEAVTLCTLYIEGKVEESIKETCDKVLTAAKNEWLSAFQSALFAASNELSMPDTVLLTVSSDVAPWFTETIRREEFHQYTLTEKEFRVVVLDAKLFHEALVFKEGADRNPVLMIEALATAHLSVKSNRTSPMPKNMLQDIKPISRESRTSRATSRVIEFDEPKATKTRRPKNLPVQEHTIPFHPQPPRPASRRALWYIAAACVVGFLFSISFIFEKATITITPKSVPVAFDISDTFTAQKDSLNDSDIVYTVMSLSGDQAMKLPSTGQKDASLKATGSVVLYNAFSTTPYKLAKGTRLQASNNQIYRTNQAVSIPAYTKSGTTIIPGSIEVGVTADVAGEASNLEVSDFSIPALANLPQAKKVYGRSKTAISGGLSGVVYTISQDSADAAAATLVDGLKSTLIAKARVQIPSGYLLYDGATTFSVDDTAQVLYSKDKDVPVGIHGTLTSYLIKEDTLAQAVVRKFVSQYGGEPVVVEKLSDMVVTPTASLNPTSDTSFTFSLSGSTNITWTIDQKAVQDALAGKKKADFQSILSDIVGVAKADVVIKPFWKQSFPDDPKRLTIVLNPAHQ